LGAGFFLEGTIIAGHQLLHRPVPWNYFLLAGGGAIGAPLLFAALKTRNRHMTLAGWAGILMLGLLAQHRFGLYATGNNDVLLVAGPRVTLNATSPAIDRVKSDVAAPFRIVGLNNNFTGDYPAVYGLEGIQSCAPLSNPALLDLVTNYPGIQFGNLWEITVADPAQAQPLLALLNVKYLLASPGTAPVAGYRVLGRDGLVTMGKPAAWPSAIFSDQIISIASNADFITCLSQKGERPFIALTPEQIKKAGAQSMVGTNENTIVPAVHYRLSPNSTSFDVQAPSAGLVCLTEGQAP